MLSSLTTGETLHGALLQLGDEITQVKLGGTLQQNTGNAWDHNDASIDPVPPYAQLAVVTRYRGSSRTPDEVQSVCLVVPEEYMLEVQADHDPSLYQEDELCMDALALGKRLLRTPRLIAAQAFRGSAAEIFVAAPIYPEGGIVRPDGRTFKRSGYFSSQVA